MNLYVTDIGSTLSEKLGVTSVLLTERGGSPSHPFGVNIRPVLILLTNSECSVVSDTIGV